MGTGAAGSVSLVRDAQTSQKFALKVLKDLSPLSVANFEREALFLSKLRHPGLVAVHGFSKSGPCYWMDFIDGVPISEAAKKAPPEQVASWFHECLEALDYLHTQGVLHGDLKPGNILVDRENHARLVDFGLASVTSTASPPQAEEAGLVRLKGSLPYLAPESLQGERLPAGDLYALGTVFYEILTGRHPRPDARGLSDLFSPEFKRLETWELNLPSRTARIIDRMIETDRSARFKSARDTLDAFGDAFGADKPLAAEALREGGEPLHMTGRDAEWAAAVAFLERKKGNLLLVRGVTGTGKTRFARELSFHAALRGLKAERREVQETLSPSERRDLFRRLDPAAGDGLLVLEANDDRLDSETSAFLGALAREEGVLEIALSPEGFLDPARREGQESLLKKRTEKLGETDRSVLEALAAEGDSAPPSGIAFVTGLTPVAVAESLSRLAAMGLSRVRGLVDSADAEIHRRWIAYWEPAGDVEALARHALRLPSHPKRQAWVVEAAESLEQRGAVDHAIRLYRDALEFKPPDTEREPLLRGLANAYGTKGAWREQIQTLEEWFFDFPDDPEGLNPVKYHLATAVALRNLGDHAEARRRLELCLEAGRPDLPAHRPRLARAHALLGRFESARALLLDPSEQKAEVFLNEARLEADLGHWVPALQALEESEAVAWAVSSRAAVFAAVLEKGNLAMKLDRLDDAEAAYARALEIASEPRDEALLARVHQNRGVLNLRRGDLALALEEFAAARRLLLFFGTPVERSLNHLEHALAQAQVGRFTEARALLDQAQATSDAPEALASRKEVEKEIAQLESGKIFGNPDQVRERLVAIHQKLPDALKISFEDRPDYQRLVLKKEPPMDILNQLNAIMRDLLTSSEVDDILTRILEGAIQLSGAERGFLVTRDEQVRASRNLSKEFLKGNEFRMSLSAVRQAMESGEVVVTDNAALDPRFKNAASIQELELKAICVLPLKTAEGVIGVLYLDHRYQPLVFRDDDVKLLQMFADQAALAFEKAKTIEDMKDEIVTLKKEVEEQRLQLTHEYAEIVGQSRPMMEVLSLVDRLIDSSIPVWIYGESGTGKEMIARALHFKGPRAKKAFVSENCSSLPETLLESELFGHKKGSFTHADRDKKGLLHHADGGTVFLDEIADMSAQLQAKMLRFLQEGEIRPVGSNELIKVDVRVVSASNKDLNALVREGKFREDLFYRLNGMTVTLPALRDRAEDIPILVQHFLKRLALAEKKDPLEIAPEALELLTEYAWPGNVRELENTIRSGSLFHYKGKLLPKSFHFKKVLFGGEAVSVLHAPEPAKAAKSKGKDFDEKSLLLKALKENGFHKGEAAEALGISRRYLYTQMSKFGIPTKRVSMKAYVEKELSP